MKLTISETARLTGISVRTLHYYDEIGLLKPDYTDATNGYRYYGDTSLERLQQIMFYRELDFSLKAIKELLSSPDLNKMQALENQKQLLILKKQRLERLIELADKTMRGEDSMSFKEFDSNEINAQREKYAAEAKEKWGKTEAYKEFENKSKSYGSDQWGEINGEAAEIMKAFAECRELDAGDEKVQKLVERWQKHISDNYYNCTKQILAGLGLMYTGDERFTENIDKFGEGTAKLMSEAIEIYCK